MHEKQKIEKLDFEVNLRNPKCPVAINFTPNNNLLMVAFAGQAGQLGMQMFEFSNITYGITNINKIFLRDPNRLWYHHGLPNIGNNIDDIALFIRQYSSHQSTKRIVMFGNSGGGYAALLFGHLLNANEVHVFSPKTFINPILRILNNDTVERNLMIKLLFSKKVMRKYFDLKKVFIKSINYTRNFHIYFAMDNKIDNMHATRISSIDGVYMHPYKYGKHNLIRLLKESGELTNIIHQSVN